MHHHPLTRLGLFNALCLFCSAGSSSSLHISPHDTTLSASQIFFALVLPTQSLPFLLMALLNRLLFSLMEGAINMLESVARYLGAMEENELDIWYKAFWVINKMVCTELVIWGVLMISKMEHCVWQSMAVAQRISYLFLLLFLFLLPSKCTGHSSWYSWLVSCWHFGISQNSRILLWPQYTSFIVTNCIHFGILSVQNISEERFGPGSVFFHFIFFFLILASTLKGD